MTHAEPRKMALAEVTVDALSRFRRRMAEAVPAGPSIGRESVLVRLRSLGLVVKRLLMGRAEIDIAEPEGG